MHDYGILRDAIIDLLTATTEPTASYQIRVSHGIETEEKLKWQNE